MVERVSTIFAAIDYSHGYLLNSGVLSVAETGISVAASPLLLAHLFLFINGLGVD